MPRLRTLIKGKKIRITLLLQASIADYMQLNFAASEMIHLVPDTLRLMRTLTRRGKLPHEDSFSRLMLKKCRIVAG